jgi:hypothetical protein
LSVLCRGNNYLVSYPRKSSKAGLDLLSILDENEVGLVEPDELEMLLK